MMRILIDLQACQSESRFRGIGRYSMSLSLAIARNAGNHEVWILLNDRFPDSVPWIRQLFSGLVPKHRVKVFAIPSNVAESRFGNLWLTHVSELIRDSFIASLKPDIVHIASLFEGWADDVVTSIKKLPGDYNVSATLYDLIPLLNRDSYLSDITVRNYYFRKIDYLKKSDLLLAISESSRQEVLNELNFQEHQVVNISAAVDHRFQSQTLTELACKKLMRKYGIERSILMYSPGGFDKRKNLKRLFEAYSMLPHAVRQQHQLLITGRLPKNTEAQISAYASKYGITKGEYILTGYVDDADLISLYNLCKLFIFPSTHEGFGLPALEAMSCGAATIGSNTSSIPEVIGRSDALFNPYSAEDIGRLMHLGLTDPGFLSSLEDTAAAQSKLFSWDNSARKALEAFERLSPIRSGDEELTEQALYKKLIFEISKVEKISKKDDHELAQIASCIAKNLSPNKKKMLVDISELVQRDAKSGIQRVVRSILINLLENPPSSYDVVPVYWGGQGYYHASRFLNKMSLLSSDKSLVEDVEDEIVDVSCNDIFLGLDLTAHLSPYIRSTLEEFRNIGAEIYFVVYDILLIHHPEWWPEGLSEMFRHWLQDISEVSTGLVCISEATALEVKDWVLHFGPNRVDYLKIDHFHLGADIRQSIPSTGLPQNAKETLASIQSKITFLMVGTIEPRKGYAQVIEAFDLLWKSDLDINLVIVGKHGWNVDTLVQKLKQNDSVNSRFFWLQGISDEYLEQVYASSTVLLAASEGEGFGLPLIEAAQHKLPIIARNLGVFHEVAGDNAFYFKASQPEHLAEAIRDWLHLYKNGQVPMSKALSWLTWEESTQQLLDAILSISK
ncbi:MAG: glycosyltransferase family 4 protein [Leptolyngbyaceae cyanobacterium]